MPLTSIRQFPGGGGQIPPGHGRTGTGGRRNIYVSSSTGNDANSGLTPAAPVATLAAGKALIRSGIDDWLLLKKDDEWTEAIGQWTTSGLDFGHKQRIGSYGTGTARPKIKSGVSDGLYTTTEVNYLEVRGIHFTAHSYDGTSGAPAGIRIGGKSESLLVQYCKIENYADGIRLDAPVAVGSSVSNPQVQYNVIADIYANASSPSNGIYMARTINARVDYNHISKVGEVDPGPDHHGIYLRGGSTYGCDWSDVRFNNIFEVASHAVLNRSNNANVYRNTIAKAGIGLGFRGQDPVTPYATGLIGCDCGRNTVTMGRDTNGSTARGWGMVLEHVSNPATGLLGLDSWQNLYLDSGTATDPHPLIIHPSYPTLNGAGVFLVHWVDGVCWEWQGSVKLNDAVTSPSTMIEFHSTRIKSTGVHYVFEHNLANGHHYAGSFCNLLSGASSGNRYRYNGSNETQATWKTHLTTSTNTDETIPAMTDTSRTLATYDTVVGGAGTFDDLVALLRAQDESNWRWELTGDAISDYLRAGFDV